MTAKPRFRDRDDVEVAILDALVDRPEGGMTVFELRSRVDADIDDIETALAALKRDGLIAVERSDGAGSRPVIKPDDRVIPTGDDYTGPSLFDRLRERLPF